MHHIMDRIRLDGPHARSVELIGDLRDGYTSAAGEILTGILAGTKTATCADTQPYDTPGALGSDACREDACCAWSYIVADMQASFAGCSPLARGAIRQGFHDAGAWDTSSSYGGADGSLLLSDELNRKENRGLEEIGNATRAWYTKYKPDGISMADLIQTGAIVATATCPGGPKIRMFVGRQDDERAAPEGKLPSASDTADSLIELFANKTLSALDLVALVGAHTTSRQRFFDTKRVGAPQDSTPGSWDNKFYSDTLRSDNSTVLVFPSDKNLAKHPATSGTWAGFAATSGSTDWNRVGGG